MCDYEVNGSGIRYDSEEYRQNIYNIDGGKGSGNFNHIGEIGGKGNPGGSQKQKCLKFAKDEKKRVWATINEKYVQNGYNKKEECFITLPSGKNGNYYTYGFTNYGLDNYNIHTKLKSEE